MLNYKIVSASYGYTIKNSRIFTFNMTSHASRQNSAPGEVFEFLYGLNSLNMHKKQIFFLNLCSNQGIPVFLYRSSVDRRSFEARYILTYIEPCFLQYDSFFHFFLDLFLSIFFIQIISRQKETCLSLALRFQYNNVFCPLL